MVALRHRSDIGDGLTRLAAALESLDLGPGASVLSKDRDRLAGTIRSYLIPRAADPAATPATVVVAGPTGSGKSTLVNSLVGLDVSPTGALRPTTTTPVVLTARRRHLDHGVIGGVACEVVTGEAPILESMVLVDAPDIDSTSTGHRAMAEALIDNADVVVFVTSALRYADDVPWQVLRRAVSRGTPVIHVLNRVGSATAGAIVDFKARLGAAGLDNDLVTVPEHHLADTAQKVPSLAVQSLRQRLTALMVNQSNFAGAVFERVLRSTVAQVVGLARSITEIQQEIDDLEAELSRSLAARISNLTLAGVGRALYAPPPERTSRWAVRRWKSESASGEVDESTVADRIVAIVHADIRHWLVAERDIARPRHVEAPAVVSEVTAAARPSVGEWMGFVSQIVAEEDSRHAELGEAVLIDAATADAPVPAVEMMFGEDGPALVDRARRELIGRIEALYDLAGSLLVAAMARHHGDLDDSELRASLGAVTATLAPVHA